MYIYKIATNDFHSIMRHCNDSIITYQVTQKSAVIPTKWTEEEIKISIEGNTIYMYKHVCTNICFAVIKKHGKNVEALARQLPSKSVPQCRNFFTNYKRKLNLPRLIAEYEIRNVHILIIVYHICCYVSFLLLKFS